VGRLASGTVVEIGSFGAFQTIDKYLPPAKTLTLNAGKNDYFIINVSGKYAMSGTSAIRLTGGIDTTRVLFNITGTGEQVAFTGKSVGVGTYLAVNRDISVSGATINGSVIGGMNHKIALTSAAKVQVNTPHFAPPPEWKFV
jgi:choice-of-anchor A domain-containing protein